MQFILILFSTILLTVQSPSQPSHDKILGTWGSEEQSRTIEFIRNGDTYDAIIRSAGDAGLVGQKQITGLKAGGENAFKNGTLHIIKKQRTAGCSARLVDDQTLELKASLGFLSKSQTWTRL